MNFKYKWIEEAGQAFTNLRNEALEKRENRQKRNIKKSTKQEGLYKQVNKAVGYLKENPKHPSLHTHPYDSFENPYNKNEKVFGAYCQNHAPGAYRLIWCYGPNQQQITILDIIVHPNSKKSK